MNYSVLILYIVVQYVEMLSLYFVYVLLQFFLLLFPRSIFFVW